MERVSIQPGSAGSLVKVLVVDDRLSPRKELVGWLQRRANVQPEGLAPGGSLDAVRQRDFDLLLLGRIGHRHLLKELVQGARDRNPDIVLTIVSEEVAPAWLRRQAAGVLQR